MANYLGNALMGFSQGLQQYQDKQTSDEWEKQQKDQKQKEWEAKNFQAEQEKKLAANKEKAAQAAETKAAFMKTLYAQAPTSPGAQAGQVVNLTSAQNSNVGSGLSIGERMALDMPVSASSKVNHLESNDMLVPQNVIKDALTEVTNQARLSKDKSAKLRMAGYYEDADKEDKAAALLQEKGDMHVESLLKMEKSKTDEDEKKLNALSDSMAGIKDKPTFDAFIKTLNVMPEVKAAYQQAGGTGDWSQDASRIELLKSRGVRVAEFNRMKNDDKRIALETFKEARAAAKDKRQEAREQSNVQETDFDKLTQDRKEEVKYYAGLALASGGKGDWKVGLGRDPDGRALIKQVSAYLPKLAASSGMTPGDVVARKAEVTATTSALTQTTKDIAAITPYKKMLDTNIDNAISLSKNVIQTDSKYANKTVNWIKQNLGDNPDAAEYLAQMEFVKTEAARVVNNPRLTGALTVQAKKDLGEIINGDMPLKSMERVLRRVQIDGNNRVNALFEEKNKLENVLSGKKETKQLSSRDQEAKTWALSHMDNPDAKEILKRLGE